MKIKPDKQKAFFLLIRLPHNAMQCNGGEIYDNGKSFKRDFLHPFCDVQVSYDCYLTRKFYTHCMFFKCAFNDNNQQV